MSTQLKGRWALGLTVLLFCSCLIIVGACLRRTSKVHEHVKAIPSSPPVSPSVESHPPAAALEVSVVAPPLKENRLLQVLRREGKALRAALGPIDRVPPRWLLHTQGRAMPTSQDKVLFLGPLWSPKCGPESEKPEDRMSWAILALDKVIGETKGQSGINEDILDLLHHPPAADSQDAIDLDVLSAFRMRCCLYLSESKGGVELESILSPLASDPDPALRGFAQVRLMELKANVDGMAALLANGSSRTVEVALAELCRSRWRVPPGFSAQGGSLGSVCRPVFTHPGIESNLIAFIGSSTSPDAKALAIDALATRSDNPAGLHCLLSVAQLDASQSVRSGALKAMIAIPNNPSVEAVLIQSLLRADVSSAERSSATLALMSQKSATTAEFLAQRIMAEGQDWDLRGSCAVALSSQHLLLSKETRSRLVAFARNLADTQQREFLLKRIGEFP